MDPPGNALESAVFADVHPPIWPCDFRSVFKGWFPSEKNHLRTQKGVVFRKPRNWEHPDISLMSQEKPGKSCS
jgi:hypothetical protein